MSWMFVFMFMRSNNGSFLSIYLSCFGTVVTLFMEWVEKYSLFNLGARVLKLSVLVWKVFVILFYMFLLSINSVVMSLHVSYSYLCLFFLVVLLEVYQFYWSSKESSFWCWLSSLFFFVTECSVTWMPSHSPIDW